MFDNAKLHIYMNMISDTELILTDDKKIYHLNLSKDQIADDIILVGDPDRVTLISNKFDAIEHKVSNREFVTHTGQLNGKRISAISTGIGTDNIDIVINELDALVNIDFITRTINSDKKSSLDKGITFGLELVVTVVILLAVTLTELFELSFLSKLFISLSSIEI